MYKNFFDGYEAIIFDLDGTVVHSEIVWNEAVEEVFTKEIISENPYLGERGQALDVKIFNIMQANSFKSTISSETYYELILDNFFKNIDKVEITPGFVEFATILKDKRKKLVLVTNSDSRVTNGIIEKLNLKRFFDLVVTLDDITYPKPAPDIYNLALKNLGLKKEQVLVFEDSINGALAAENADLKMIIVLPDGFRPIDYGSKNRIFIETFETLLDEMDYDGDTYILDAFSR